MEAKLSMEEQPDHPTYTVGEIHTVIREIAERYDVPAEQVEPLVVKALVTIYSYSRVARKSSRSKLLMDTFKGMEFRLIFKSMKNYKEVTLDFGGVKNRKVIFRMTPFVKIDPKTGQRTECAQLSFSPLSYARNRIDSESDYNLVVEELRRLANQKAAEVVEAGVETAVAPEVVDGCDDAAAAGVEAVEDGAGVVEKLAEVLNEG